MIVAVDVHYGGSKAKAVSIAFENWEDEFPVKINTVELERFEEYVPGEFYKRELPCIVKVLEKSDLDQIEAIIIDGYVILNDKGKLGLGGYLYEMLNRKVPIIGVAKRPYFKNEQFVKEISRGSSKNPLNISSMGLAVEHAASFIRKMNGKYRIPTLLKILDQKTRARY